MIVTFPALAQDGATPYVVMAMTHARSCPQLTCPVVRTYEPSDPIAVTEVVTGASVFGNDQWVSVKEDGVAFYIHSASVLRLDDGEVATDTGADPLDTSEWVPRETGWFSLSAPVNWRPINSLLEGDLPDSFNDYYDSDDLDSLRQRMARGDLYILWDVSAGAVLQVTFYDFDMSSVSPESVLVELEDYVIGLGGDILSEAILNLPAGEAARLHGRLDEGRFETELLLYGVISDGRLYGLMFSSLWTTNFEDIEPIFDAIADTFDPVTADI